MILTVHFRAHRRCVLQSTSCVAQIPSLIYTIEIIGLFLKNEMRQFGTTVAY